MHSIDGFQLKTPVAFLVFNRPDTTQRVFEEIRRARPPKLLVVADGPRADRPDEADKCKAVRTIIDTVDWPCEVIKDYSNVNLGCKRRVSSGLDWVFNTVEEAIILEDDCLPHPTFFRFCQDLLEKYRDDERIFMISGDNFQFGKKRTAYSYYFSWYCHIWGWASWRRAWQKYDVNMELWPEIRDKGWLKNVFDERKESNSWKQIFDAVYDGRINTWDYQWSFVCLTNNFLSILPNVNLISNIGFGAGTTHTNNMEDKRANLPTQEMLFPLVHPTYMIRDEEADDFTYRNFVMQPLLKRIKDRLRRLKA